MELPLQVLRPFMGARILKTGLAAFIVLVIFQYIGTEYVGLGAVMAILAIQPSLTRSRKLFGEQMLGNLVGGVVGIALSFWAGSSPLMMALGVVLVLGLLVQFKLSEVASLGAVVVIFLMERPHQGILLYSAMRLAAIAAGLSVGYLVNRFVRPPRFHARLTEELRAVGATLDAFAARIGDSLGSPTTLTKEQIKAEAGGIQKRLESVRYLLDLSAETEGAEQRRRLLTKVTTSMFIFTESLMEAHKAVLQAGGLGSDSLREPALELLESVVHLRQSVVTAALDAAPRGPEADERFGRARAAIEQLLDRLVEHPESRSLGMALWLFLAQVRHMSERMEQLERMLAET